MGSGAFARVLTGWTGTAVVTPPYPGVAVTVTPLARESVASFVARLVSEVAVKSAFTLTVSVSSSGVITLTGTDAFDMTLTGTVESRTKWDAGPYSSVSSVTGTGAYSNAWVPANGLKLADPLLATSKGTFTGDDGYGTAPWRVSAGSRLEAWTGALTLPDLDGYENDYWHDGRLFGRVVATNIQRVPMSSYLRSTGTVRFVFDVVEVA